MSWVNVPKNVLTIRNTDTKLRYEILNAEGSRSYRDSSCSSVVKHTPRDGEIVSSYNICLSLIISLIRPLAKVQHYWFSIKDAQLCSFEQTKLDLRTSCPKHCKYVFEKVHDRPTQRTQRSEWVRFKYLPKNWQKKAELRQTTLQTATQMKHDAFVCLKKYRQIHNGAGYYLRDWLRLTVP